LDLISFDNLQKVDPAERQLGGVFRSEILQNEVDEGEKQCEYGHRQHQFLDRDPFYSNHLLSPRSVAAVRSSAGLG
jgi:hypothetical protein